MKQFIIIWLLALGICSINVSAQTKKPVKRTTSTQKTTAKPAAKKAPQNSREFMMGDDGFEWYKVCKNGKWGVEDRKGELLVPYEFTDIVYIPFKMVANLVFGSGFMVKKDNDCGYYSREGRCIIPFTRHYKFVYKFADTEKPEIGTSYTCTLEHGVAFCDADGKEVCRVEGDYYYISPVYEKGKFYYQIQKEKDKYGIIDGDGNLIVEPKYEYVSTNDDGEFGAYVGEGDNEHRVVLAHFSSIRTTRNPFANNHFDLPSSSSSSSTASSSSSSSSSNSSSSNNSGGGTTTIVVEHQHTPQPMTEWVPCGACGHNPGVCQTCLGMGESASGRRCISCHGTGKCHFCNGQGGRYQTVYR